MSSMMKKLAHEALKFLITSIDIGLTLPLTVFLKSIARITLLNLINIPKLNTKTVARPLKFLTTACA